MGNKNLRLKTLIKPITKKLIFVGFMLCLFQLFGCVFLPPHHLYNGDIKIKNSTNDSIEMFFENMYMVTLSPQDSIIGNVHVTLLSPYSLILAIPHRGSLYKPNIFTYIGHTSDDNSLAPHIFRIEGKIKDSLVYHHEFTVSKQNHDSLEFMNQIEIK